MSKGLKVVGGAVIMLFILPGCGFKGPYFGKAYKASFIPAEFEKTQQIIHQAETTQGAGYCPEKIARAKELAKEGEEIYWACRSEEAMAKLAEAQKLAKEAETCTMPDSDGDGVPDHLDKCPNTPMGVKVDGGGCPLDTDGDGVFDGLDKCPGTPKGVKVDAKGCPLGIDTDGDGVLDDVDRCPGTPKGAGVDFNGCWVISPIHFDTNKTAIGPRDAKALDAVAAVLNNNPTLRMAIQGHTDNRGSKQYNMALSQRRAKEVKDYLVSKGVAGDRLPTVGLGFSRPLATNKNPEGRAMNRRVELKPIK